MKIALSMYALAVAGVAGAQDLELARQLAGELAYEQAFDDGESACIEKMSAQDIEGDVANTPELLGGIQPGDPEWVEARALYADMLRDGCLYGKAAVLDAFVGGLAQSLSTDDMRALIAFYRSDLGVTLRNASISANSTAYRAYEPVVGPGEAYDAFAEKIAAILARRTPSGSPAEAQRTPVALETADAAVALSDRFMQDIVKGRVSQAFEMARTHTLVADADIGKMIADLEQVGPAMANRFGESIGYELLHNDSIGGSLIRSVFLHRFQNHAMVWMFVWYRGDSGWMLSTFRYSDDVSLLFGR
ncbi:DUF2059 domain-containing protein [Pseudoxanthomonas suwonensis]|nr:DUF2059 domain-containing protein [Pseudoxanthomonas suwonensis]